MLEARGLHPDAVRQLEVARTLGGRAGVLASRDARNAVIRAALAAGERARRLITE